MSTLNCQEESCISLSFAIITQELKIANEKYAAMSEAEQAMRDARLRDDGTEIKEVPEVVSERMIKRIVLFTGVPLLIAFTFFPAFYYLKVVMKIGAFTFSLLPLFRIRRVNG